MLLPYFELDLSNPNGLTTLFAVNNSAATAVLVQMTIWSDLGVPVLSIPIYLTGYDVQSVNLRDIIVNGLPPQTASVGQDPTDTISPRGPLSQDIDFTSCAGILPNRALPAVGTQHLQLALTGRFSPILNGCAGQALGDNIARGYITMDTVSGCDLTLPGGPNYFRNGGTGIATNQNVLWGDWFIINTSQNLAEGGNLVRIEADAANPATSTPNNYTFYGRLDGFSASDNREPLATEFATRYLNGGGFSSGTSLIVWRDPKVANDTSFTCPAMLGVTPPWYPLGEEGVVFFDEQENASALFTSPLSPPPFGVPSPFPAATQRVQVGSAALPLPSGFNFGWLFLDLNTAVAAAGSVPPVDSGAAQAFVISTFAANGHFAVGIDATRLDSACSAAHFVP